MKRYIFFAALMLLCISCKKKPEPARLQEALGTICSVQAFEDGTRALYDELFAQLEEIETIFSVTRADTELAAVNLAAGEHPVGVGNALFSVLQTAQHFSELTHGAFDITVGPLVTLWGINTEFAHVPSDTERIAVLPLISYTNMLLDEKEKTVFLAKKGMAIDVGGIAKGYAADVLASIMQAHKVQRAIIDLGGNIYLCGTKLDGTDWRVGVKNPENPLDEPVLVVNIPTGENTAVVTSGVYERFFEQDGIRYHHILDTSTGKPAQTGLLSVTIIHNNSMIADALSTACFVLGIEQGKVLAEQLGANAIFIAENHAVTTTSAIATQIELRDDSFYLR